MKASSSRPGRKGLLDINLTDIRDFADNRHRKVDDRPYGGGPGMVMMPQPVSSAIRSVKQPGRQRDLSVSPGEAVDSRQMQRTCSREASDPAVRPL